MQDCPVQMFVCAGLGAQINLLYEQVQEANRGIMGRSWFWWRSTEHIPHAQICRLRYLMCTWVQLCIKQWKALCCFFRAETLGSYSRFEGSTGRRPPHLLLAPVSCEAVGEGQSIRVSITRCNEHACSSFASKRREITVCRLRSDNGQKLCFAGTLILGDLFLHTRVHIRPFVAHIRHVLTRCHPKGS